MKSNIEIGKKYIIKAGAEFWSTAMREFLIFKNDVIIKATSSEVLSADCQEVVYGIIQISLPNPFLYMFVGNASTIYMDKANGEIGIEKKYLKEI